MSRILVAAVGNVLRRDDGFGPAVAAQLGALPPGAELVETGIGGIALLQELLAGCDGLILIDAVDRGAAPGTVFRFEPEIRGPAHVPDVHLANPERVLAMAKGLGCLPARLVMIGCQPEDVDDLSEGLSAEVEAALPSAVASVREMVADWTGSA